MRILVVDDDLVTGQLLIKILTKQGYDVHHAKDAGKVLEDIQAGQFRIILTDWMMPGMDGLTLCRRIREMNLPQYVYIILLTAKSSKDDAVTGLESGADDFIVKPFDKLELLARIRAGRRLVELEDSQHETRLKLLRSEKMAAVGHLAAGVAHEINNPIGFISSNLNTLEDYLKDIKTMLGCYCNLTRALEQSISLGKSDTDLPATIKYCRATEKKYDIDFIIQDADELIQDCTSGASRIKSIVHEMRYFAHPEKQVIAPCSLSAILDKILKGLPSRQQHDIVIQANTDNLPEITCNAAHMEQAFANILHNAMEAVGNQGQITIDGDCSPTRIEIKISDTGPGIPPENLPLIFNPFFTTKDVGQGVGLGLTTALNILKMHNGSITCESAPGKGTSLTICLPLNGEKI